MTEWLELMIEEVRRKLQEANRDEQELETRDGQSGDESQDSLNQSK